MIRIYEEDRMNTNRYEKERVFRIAVAAVVSLALVLGIVPMMSIVARVVSDDSVLKPVADGSATYAASGSVKKLARNTTYVSALQGSKKHTISWDFYYYESSETLYTYIYVDGKSKVITTTNILLDFDEQVNVSVASVNSDTKLICLEIMEENNGWYVLANIYRYDTNSQALVYVGDVIKQNPFKSEVIRSGGLFKASKNKLYFRWLDPSAHSIGMIQFDAIFKYSKGKLKGNPYAKLVSYNSSPSSKKTLTARKNFKVYTKPGGKKVKFAVKKGNKVRAIKIKKFKANRYYIQIKKGSRKGWIRASKSTSNGSLLFKEVFFAV
jgi:hypothetical protein